MKIKDRKFIAVASLIMLFIVVSIFFYYSKANSAGAVVQTSKEITITKGTLKVDLVSDGILDMSAVPLKFGAGGIVKEITAELGQIVKAGDVIARLDNEKYRLEIEVSRANYQAALAKLEKAKLDYANSIIAEESQLDSAISELETTKLQYQSMLEVKDAYTEQEIQLKKITLEKLQKNYDGAVKSYQAARNSQAIIDQAEAEVKQALAALNKTELNLKDIELTAPIDGRLLALNGEVGENISTSQEFAVITSQDGIFVTAKVLELDVAQVIPGQEVEIELEALPDKVFIGKVDRIEEVPLVDTSGIVAYGTKILLDEQDPNIRIGMSCTVSFIIKQKKDVLIIPNEAVKRVEGKQVVEVKNENGEIVTQVIKTGFTDGRNAEVLDGLELGDRVVIREKNAANI